MEKIVENREEFEKEFRDYYNGEDFNKKEYNIIKGFMKVMKFLTNEVSFFILFSIPSAFVLWYLFYTYNSIETTIIFMTFYILIYKFLIRKHLFKNMDKEHVEYCFMIETLNKIEKEKGGL